MGKFAQTFHSIEREPKLRFNGVVHPAIWSRAKRGERDALLWIREDLEELALVGGFLGGVYRRAARRLRKLER